VLEFGEVFELRDLVVGKVENAQIGVVLEARKIGDGVVGEVELFQVLKVREARDAGEAVGLDGDDAEVGEGVEIL
jgi:hypothetical protein